MKIAVKPFLFTLLSLSSCSEFIFAQSVIQPVYEAGLNAGMFIYQGDLTPTDAGSFKTPAFVLGLNGSRNLSTALAVRLDLNIGRLKGDEARYATPEYRQQRNFAFTASATEVVGSLVWNAFGNIRKWSPYVFAGAGLSLLRIKPDYSRYNPAYFASETSLSEGLNEDIDHPLPKILPILPVGAGLRYRITDRLSFLTEASYRYMRSDYLDGFSQSANPAEKDHYYKYSAGLAFSFGGRNAYDCPVVKY